MSSYSSILQSHMDRLWDLVAQYGFDTIMGLRYISCLLGIKHLDWKRTKEGMQSGREGICYLDEKGVQKIKSSNGLDYFLSINDPELIICPQDIESSRLTSDLLARSITIVNSIYEEIEKRYVSRESSSGTMEGFVYEQLLNHTVLLGKRGQFRTPRHIVKLMVDLIQPQEGKEILDPVCGTGGFLLNACQYIIKEKLKKENPSLIKEDEDGFERIVSDYFYEDVDWKLSAKGFDNDNTMVKLAQLNFRMHGIEGADIEQKDILTGVEEKMNLEDFGSPVERSRPMADIILANPPFGVRVKNWQTQRMEASEGLFLKQIVALLRDGGRAAVVVPEGMVFNKTYKDIREELVERNHLDVVVSLPAGVFQPFTQGKSTIFVFTKKDPGQEDYSVWFYELESDGYSLDNNRRRLKDYPLAELLSIYKKKGSRAEEARKRAFYVSREEIQNNDFDLSYNLYKENDYVKQIVEKPQEILRQLMSLEEEVYQKMQELDSYFSEKWEM